MVNEQTFKALKKGERRAQKALYDELSPQMYAVCRRYIANAQDAEDIMIKGFFNAFTKLDQLDEPRCPLFATTDAYQQAPSPSLPSGMPTATLRVIYPVKSRRGQSHFTG